MFLETWISFELNLKAVPVVWPHPSALQLSGKGFSRQIATCSGSPCTLRPSLRPCTETKDCTSSRATRLPGRPTPPRLSFQSWQTLGDKRLTLTQTEDLKIYCHSVSIQKGTDIYTGLAYVTVGFSLPLIKVYGWKQTQSLQIHPIQKQCCEILSGCLLIQGDGRPGEQRCFYCFCYIVFSADIRANFATDGKSWTLISCSSSTCTAPCSWAVLSPHLQPSPATTT